MTADPRIEQIRAAMADFEQHGTNGPRTPGQILRDVLDILDSPPPDSETEWGWRPADDDGGLHASRVVRGGFTEDYARERVAGIPGARVLVRREVGPWTEVQP